MKQERKRKVKSIQSRLFISLCVVVFLIIIFLIIVNSFILESFYLYSKIKTLEGVYKQINTYTSKIYNISAFEEELEKISINNDFDILIKTGENLTIYSTNKDYMGVLKEFGQLAPFRKKDFLIEENEKVSFFRDIYLVTKEVALEELKFIDGEVINAKYITIDEFNNMIENGEAHKYLEYFNELYKLLRRF